MRISGPPKGLTSVVASSRANRRAPQCALLQARPPGSSVACQPTSSVERTARPMQRRTPAGRNDTVRTPVSIGIVGLGTSGAAYARVLEDLPQAELRWLCDRNVEAQLRARQRHPRVQVVSEIDPLLADESLDAVIIATPLSARYDLALLALEADKHVLLEHPMASRASQAEELVQCAARRGRRLMVGHPILFHPALRRLRDLMDLGYLGDIYYLESQRHSFRRTRASFLWDLVSHDVSVVLHLLRDEPVRVTARGESYVRAGSVDVGFCYFEFATGISAHLRFSLLDPQRTSRLSVIGSERAATFDEMEVERKLAIWEKGTGQHRMDAHRVMPARLGDVISLSLPTEEPIALACKRFIKLIRSAARLPDVARRALGVVNVLEAIDRSLEAYGAPATVGREVGRVIRLPVRPREPSGPPRTSASAPTGSSSAATS